MDRPRIADLFCGAGGSAMGLHRAGFEVVGYDIVFQKHYPFEFHQQDALTVDLSGFDAVWASPPCQGYSRMRHLPWQVGKVYPMLIEPTRRLLQTTHLPWIIENVMDAKLEAGWLCGTMFGLPFYRHRAFETNWFWLQPEHPKHSLILLPGRMLGNRAHMGHDLAGIDMDWMTKQERSQAIPPTYSEFLGKQLMQYLGIRDN